MFPTWESDDCLLFSSGVASLTGADMMTAAWIKQVWSASHAHCLLPERTVVVWWTELDDSKSKSVRFQWSWMKKRKLYCFKAFMSTVLQPWTLLLRIFQACTLIRKVKQETGLPQVNHTWWKSAKMYARIVRVVFFSLLLLILIIHSVQSMSWVEF